MTEFLFLKKVKLDGEKVSRPSKGIYVFKKKKVLDSKSHTCAFSIVGDYIEYFLESEIDDEYREILKRNFSPIINFFCKRVNMYNGSSKYSSNLQKFIFPELRFYKKAGHLSHIPEFYGLFEDHEHNLYLITEFCNRGDLTHYLSKGATTEDLFFVAREVATAIKKIHSTGLLHCDIKFDNVCITEKNKKTRVKLIDFGASKLIGSNIGFCGTIRYMAPELIKRKLGGKELVEARPSIDSWSYGIFLFKLITNSYPCGEDIKKLDSSNMLDFYEEQKLMNKTEEGLKEIIADVYGEPIPIFDSLIKIILGCLKLNPKERPDFQEICRELK